jgi:hypothetical protein
MTLLRQDGLTELRERQAALVAALVAGGELPSGFVADGPVAAATAALARKRACEVARAWPLLAAGLGPEWEPSFTAWVAGRAPEGSFADGFAFARALSGRGELPALARAELAAAEVRFGAGGQRRRLPTVRWVPGGALVQVAGRVLAVRGRQLPRPGERSAADRGSRAVP